VEVTSSEGAELALRSLYERLAQFLVINIDSSRISTILDAGCGSGRLTIPLARKIGKKRRTIGLDISLGPYQGALKVLKENVRTKKIGQVIEMIEGDVRDIAIRDEVVDLIVSNELFCDLDRQGLEQTLKEFYRILKPKGKMAHAELIPFPENKAQQLFIESNSYSLETLKPRPEWFSPAADEIAAIMHNIGYQNIIVKYFRTGLRLGFELAAKQLKEWNVDAAFIRKHEKSLRKYGIEYPMEHVVFSEKP